ncbi:hypothetical protein ACIO6U_12320 [Streptomyces sp. NPDC087422]|uniref:hypothetical protein n=1 Tax=Streptomyces sp. NPDC087422 TaxID=3365786 RepID=UPI0038004D92
MPTPHPRRAVTRSLINLGELGTPDRRVATGRMAALEAAVTIRAARRNRHKMFDAVNVYITTDRSGTPLIVAYVRYHPGFYSGVTDYADLYEIPLEALTDL